MQSSLRSAEAARLDSQSPSDSRDGVGAPMVEDSNRAGVLLDNAYNQVQLR